MSTEAQKFWCDTTSSLSHDGHVFSKRQDLLLKKILEPAFLLNFVLYLYLTLKAQASQTSSRLIFLKNALQSHVATKQTSILK